MTMHRDAAPIRYGHRQDPSFMCGCGRFYYLPQYVRWDDAEISEQVEKATVIGWKIEEYRTPICDECTSANG